ASPWPSRSAHLIYHTSITAGRHVQSGGPRLPGSLNHPGHRRVPACLARLAGKDYLTAFNDIEAVREIPDVVDIRSGNESRVAEGADMPAPLHDRWQVCRR